MFNKKIISEITELANKYDIDREALMAVIEVESAGRFGAKVNGKLEPLIRFEGHYYYRLLPRSKRNIAVTKGLASPKAGGIRNPISQTSRWRLLERAMRLDRQAALESCSWGLGQVMGSHWRWLDYASIDALVSEARSGAEGQIRLMMRFVEKANLLDKLKTHDWAGFARAYNGPAFRKNQYDMKMRDAWLKHRSNANLPGILKPEFRRHEMVQLKFGSHGDAVYQLQKDLQSLGYNLLADGDFGPATHRAVISFQQDHSLITDGIVGTQTFARLAQTIPIAV